MCIVYDKDNIIVKAAGKGPVKAVKVNASSRLALPLSTEPFIFC